MHTPREVCTAAEGARRDGVALDAVLCELQALPQPRNLRRGRCSAPRGLGRSLCSTPRGRGVSPGLP